MTTARTGHAAFNHAHVKLATARAALATRCIQPDNRRGRVLLQAHAFALNKADRDHVLFDHAANRG